MEEVKKGRSYTYILKGEPEALVLRRSDDVIGWNNHKERKLITDITLESQHSDRPLLTGALAVDVIFYFPIPHPVRAKIKAKQGDRQSTNPRISLLLNFLEHSAEGIVYACAESISESSFKKFYDIEPRTVMVVTELHGKKENNPQKG